MPAGQMCPAWHRRPQMPDKTSGKNLRTLIRYNSFQNSQGRAFTNSGIKFQLKTHPDRNSLNLNDCVFKTSTSFSALMGRRQRIIEIYTNHGEVTLHENDPRPYTRYVPSSSTAPLCQKWYCGLASLFQTGLVQVARSSGHWPSKRLHR